MSANVACETCAALLVRVRELEAALRARPTREQYNEALYAAADATGARDRLLGLLHHIEEEIEDDAHA
jgi:hypothetical protein